MRNRLLQCALLLVLLVLAAGCATTTPNYIREYEKKKIQLKAYFPAGAPFYLDRIFLEGDIEQNLQDGAVASAVIIKEVGPP